MRASEASGEIFVLFGRLGMHKGYFLVIFCGRGMQMGYYLFILLGRGRHREKFVFVYVVGRLIMEIVSFLTCCSGICADA